MPPIFLRLWTGPLPHEELFPSDRQINPLLHWLIHPIKRRLARYYLKILQKVFKLKVIAVAGSNGKTTTKNFLFAILSSVKPTIATRDNITSTYNIPSTILRCRPWTRYLILEMSIEYVGDMDFYLWLATPDIAILTLIDLEHASHLKNLDTIAREENKLLTQTPKSTLRIVNGDSPHINISQPHTHTFGFKSHLYTNIVSSKLTPDLKTNIKLLADLWVLNITLPIPGPHLAYPVSAAVTAAKLLKFGAPLVYPPLEALQPLDRRSQLIQLPKKSLIINDTYNSNPSSAKASIETAFQLAKLQKKSLVLVLSQMNELGDYELSEHKKLGLYIKSLKSKISNLYLYCIGPASQHIITSAGIGQFFNSQSQLLAAIKPLTVNPKNLILFKSSRSWHLDELVYSLRPQT